MSRRTQLPWSFSYVPTTFRTHLLVRMTVERRLLSQSMVSFAVLGQCIAELVLRREREEAPPSADELMSHSWLSCLLTQWLTMRVIMSKLATACDDLLLQAACQTPPQRWHAQYRNVPVMRVANWYRIQEK